MSPSASIENVEFDGMDLLVTVSVSPSSTPFDTTRPMHVAVQAYPDGGNAYGFNEWTGWATASNPATAEIRISPNREITGEFIIQVVATNEVTGDNAIVEQAFSSDGPNVGGGMGLTKKILLGGAAGAVAYVGYERFAK